MIQVLMVKAMGWQSFGRQFEPYLRASMAAASYYGGALRRRPCGVAWDAVPEPMVEYIDPNFIDYKIHWYTKPFLH